MFPFFIPSSLSNVDSDSAVLQNWTFLNSNSISLSLSLSWILGPKVLVSFPDLSACSLSRHVRGEREGEGENVLESVVSSISRWLLFFLFLPTLSYYSCGVRFCFFEMCLAFSALIVK